MKPGRHRRRAGGMAGRITRRSLLGMSVMPLLAASAGFVRRAGAESGELIFGLTPVFLTNDLELLSNLKTYLGRATGMSVRLVTRRTYQEITSLLVSGQLDAAWICGYPFVAYREQLDLLAVPIWRGDTLYQSYLIARAGRAAASIADLEGDVHAFSDPDSNSGYLVTRALLAERQTGPDRFFRRTLFTYGHRNVVRAVASGLAQSGSVDGYVLEVMRETEPALARAVSVVQRSEWLGFPPVAAPRSAQGGVRTRLLAKAFITMADDPLGQTVLADLRLDGFARRAPSIYNAIAAKVELVRSLG